jgi:hypothetical protein
VNLERLLSGNQWWDCDSTGEACVHSEQTQTDPSLPSRPGPRTTPTALPPPTRHCPRKLNGKGTKHTNLIFAQSHRATNQGWSRDVPWRRARTTARANARMDREHTWQGVWHAGHGRLCGVSAAPCRMCWRGGSWRGAAAIASTRSNPSPLRALDSVCVLNSSAQVSWNRNTSDASMCARAMVRRVTVCGAQNTYTHRRGGGGHGKRRRLALPSENT